MTEPDRDRPLIEVRGLVREYKVGPSTIRALDDIDLTIDRGEFVAVIGVSGSGKSTLLQLLGGLDTPTSGSIRVDGKLLEKLSPYERALYRRTTVGFVFQSYYLVPSRTAVGNIALALTFQGIYGQERRNRSEQALLRVGLTNRGHHRPGELSGGEQQRVALARALVHSPPLLLLDEPTGNLDRSTATEVLEQIGEIRRDLGTTILMVTHDEDMARRVADRIVRLCDGSLESIEENTPQ